MLCRERIYVSTDFKVSSLTIKCVFYIPEHKANRGPLKWNFQILEMQRWDKPTDGAQRVDKKNEVKMFKNGKKHVYFQSYDY